MKVIVDNAGRFSYNGIIYLQGETLEVDTSLASITTLINMGDLKICEGEIKETDKVNWESMSKKELDIYAESVGVKLDRRKTLSIMQDEFRTAIKGTATDDKLDDSSDAAYDDDVI